MGNFNVQIGGRYKVDVFKSDGSLKYSSGFFPNLITDIGLNRIGVNSDWLSYCRVGSGSTTPTASDTALAVHVYGTNNIISTSYGCATSSPYYAKKVTKWRFNAGQATGNISEVGVGWAASGGSLFSRALVVDGDGDPTTITVLSDEYLDVTYEFRYYAPLTDTTGNITLDGVSYAWTGRASSVTTADNGGWYVERMNATNTSGGIGLAYDGSIGAITGIPTGNSSGIIPQSAEYVNDSLLVTHTMSFGLSNGNLASGIGALFLYMGMGKYQFGFSPNIPKTSSKTMTLNFTVSWTRKTL